MSLTTTEKEYTEVIQSAEQAIAELEQELSSIIINVGANSKDVLTAIKYIFGPSYISSNGTSQITYEMFSTVASKLRSAGKLKVGEYL